MAIFICDGNNCSKTKYTTSEQVIEGYDIEHILDQDNMDKQLKRGNNVYLIIDPYDSEMGAGEEGAKDRMCWYKTEEEANDDYWQLMDNI